MEEISKAIVYYLMIGEMFLSPMVLSFCHQQEDGIGNSIFNKMVLIGDCYSKLAVIIGQVPFLTPIWIKYTFYHLVQGRCILKVVIDIIIVLFVW